MADPPAAPPASNTTTKADQKSINATLPPYELMADTFSINNDNCPGKCVVHGAGTPREWDIRKGYGLSGATVVFMGMTLSKFEIDVTIFTQQDYLDFLVFFAKYLRREAVQSGGGGNQQQQAASAKARADALAQTARDAFNTAKAQQSNPNLTQNQKQALVVQAQAAADNARAASDQVVTLPGPDLGSMRALGIYHPALAALGIGSMVVEDVTQFEEDADGNYTCTIKCIEYKKPKPIILKPNGSIPGVGAKQPTNKDAIDVQLQEAQQEFQHLHDQDAGS
jgi:hypothetical protein